MKFRIIMSLVVIGVLAVIAVSFDDTPHQSTNSSTPGITLGQ